MRYMKIDPIKIIISRVSVSTCPIATGGMSGPSGGKAEVTMSLMT